MLLKEIEYKSCEMKRGGEYDDIASCKKKKDDIVICYI